MKKLDSNQIRDLWLKFFVNKGHKIIPSSSLVPQNDPTLLWINSGVAAIKQYFDGSVVPEHKRLVNVQKCIRTNDIESVGFTARHQTFFEMLGNFSIGDYFRESIIPWAFEILTTPDYFGLDQDLLYFTYYPDDIETRDLWIKCGVDPTHLIPLTGNFWEIGAGPSGPNTEVFYDRGPKYDPQKIGLELLKKDLENDRYLEIWGIVFSQFNADPSIPRSQYPLLPNKNIDTGAGLERIASILQGAETNFETDTFVPLKSAIEKLTKFPYQAPHLTSYRIIMDHTRSLFFALADGATFGATGRGYVLRRLLRRAALHGDKLGIKPPFIYKLLPAVSQKMGDFYPSLGEKQTVVSALIKEEEERFIKALVQAKDILIRTAGVKSHLNGAQLFVLYDAHGLPLDLSLDFAKELGITTDTNGFDELLAAQKERARGARSNLDSMNHQSKDLLEFTTPSTFLYERRNTRGRVIGLFRSGARVNKLQAGETGEVILDQTNFYAEMGGQVHDIGMLVGETTNASVNDVRKAPHGQHLHQVVINQGEIREGDELRLIIDRDRRLLIMRNHSATHLLQRALLEVLGPTIHQSGSYVDDEHLRFDFTFLRALTTEELQQVEDLVNLYIARAYKSITTVTTLKQAINTGAIAEFDHKYDSENVRLVNFGDISKELCGGTHVDNTQEIGFFVIESEASIASGVRRIVGSTSLGAHQYYKNQKFDSAKILTLLRANNLSEGYEKANSLSESISNLKKENMALLQKNAALSSINIIERAQQNASGVAIIVADLGEGNKETLTHMVDTIKSEVPNYFTILLAHDGGRINFLASASAFAVSHGYGAHEWLSKIMDRLNGRGGGKDTFAMGAADFTSQVPSVIQKIKEELVG